MQQLAKAEQHQGHCLVVEVSATATIRPSSEARFIKEPPIPMLHYA
jgi:hypothetical protein